MKYRILCASHLLDSLLLALIVAPVLAPTSHAQTIVDFPDPALEAAVRATLGIPADDILDTDLVGTGFTSLSADNLGIVELSGLEFCTELNDVTLSNNLITDLSPLTANEGLGGGDAIDLSGNPLSENALCNHAEVLRAWGANVTTDLTCPGSISRHAADLDSDLALDLTETLRIIQLFNAGDYGCAPESEDGFEPGGDTRDCIPHSADYLRADWSIELSELLRAVQMFNTQSYISCPGSEDGFCPRDPAELPNVLFFILETTRATRIGAERNEIPVAPFLTSLGDEGARFSRAMTGATWTNPSVASLFTGMYPNAFKERVGRGRYNIVDEAATFAEWFTGLGYDCRGFQTNFWAGPNLGFAQGFAEDRYVVNNEFPAALQVNEALATFDDWQEPFLTFMQWHDPHGPYAPPVEYQEIFGDAPEPTNFLDNFYLSPPNYLAYLEALFSAWIDQRPPGISLTPLGLEAQLYRYDAEIRYMDDRMSSFVATVRERYPNTIIIVVADHGEALQERELLVGHGHTLYDEQANVPLILNGPGIGTGDFDAPVETIGLLPTLANAMGVPPHPQWQSRDCFEQVSEPEPVHTHSWVFFDGDEVEGNSVVWNGLKLIEHTQLEGPHLFDLTADPGETNNIAVDRPDDVATLQAILDTHLDRVELVASET